MELFVLRRVRLKTAKIRIRMRICYGILSSSTDGKIVSQLVRSLGDISPVLIHHDYSQQADFALDSGVKAIVIQDYIQTEWGQWSQAEAIIKLLNHAVRHEEFDYFQLLSESCLPIAPTTEFSAYLKETKPDACIGLIRVKCRADDLGTINYAWRYLATNRFIRKALVVLSQLCMESVGRDSVGARALVEGLSVVAPAKISKLPALPIRRALLSAMLAIAKCWHPFRKEFDCYVGSTWWCLSRKAAEYALHELDRQPHLVSHYKQTQHPDESIFHTLIGNSGFKKIAGINHYISWKERANGPDEITKFHLPKIRESNKFFARKFSKSIADETRQEIVSRSSR